MNPAYGLKDLAAMAPALLAFLGALAVLAADIPLRRQASKRAVEFLAAFSLLAGLAWACLHGGKGLEGFGGVVVDDGLANYASGALALIGLLTLVLARRQGARLGLLHGEFYALLLFALGGMMLFAASKQLMLSFIALETFSLAMYVLAGFNKAWQGNREAALKYFLLGAFAAAFFLMGMALLFGAGGTLDSGKLAQALHGLAAGDPRRLMLTAGFMLVVVAIAFKLGLAPFHLWVPDVYEGAPTPVTAFFSAGTKVAVFAALLRLAKGLPLAEGPFVQVVGVIAVLTLLAGNLGALQQAGLKRLLAYSSIAHSGYALVGLLGGGPQAAPAVMTYVAAYALMNFLSFALLAANEPLAGGEEPRPLTLADLQGQGFARPWLGLAFALAMFSMGGLPPTAGFFAKLGVFNSALASAHPGWAVAAILNSVLSAAVYLRVLVALYMRPAEAPAPASGGAGWALGAGALICSLLLLAWGILPASLSALAGGL